MNLLNEAQMEWVRDHEYFFNVPNRSLSREDAVALFAIYSWVSGKTQKPTACGRCVASAKAAVWSAYNKTLQS